MVENTVLTEESLELLEQKARYLYQFNPAAAQALRLEIEQKRYRLLRTSFLEPPIEIDAILLQQEQTMENPESLLEAELAVEEALLEPNAEGQEEAPEVVLSTAQTEMVEELSPESELEQPLVEEPVALIDQRQPKPLQWDQLSLF